MGEVDLNPTECKMESVSMGNLQGRIFLALLERSDPQKHMSTGDFRLKTKRRVGRASWN